MVESLHFKSIWPFLNNHEFTIILMMLLDYAIVFFIFFLGTSIRKMKPTGPQNLTEWIVGYVKNYADDIIGPEAPRFYGLLMFFFFYILIGNFMGLVPGLISPTSSLSVTAALAISVFIIEWFSGIKKQGLIGHLAHYTGGPGIPGPLKPFMFFVEILSDISRPLSLSFRLFGNIVAKEILLSVLVFLVILFYPQLKENAVIAGGIGGFAFIMRPLILVLGVLVSIIQAGVFTLLTAIYISGAVASHSDHGEEHAH